MEKPYMDPWPNLYDHDDDYDYQKDVKAASQISRDIHKSLIEHHQNIKDVVVFSFNQLVTKLQQSNDPDKEEKIKKLNYAYSEFLDRAGEAEQRQADLYAGLITKAASVPSLDGIDHLTKMDIDVCIDLLMRLIDIYYISAGI